MGCDRITPKQQHQWIKDQIRRRQYWLAEGIRGGHSYESCAQYERDVAILLAIQERFAPATMQQDLFATQEEQA